MKIYVTYGYSGNYESSEGGAFVLDCYKTFDDAYARCLEEAENLMDENPEVWSMTKATDSVRLDHVDTGAVEEYSVIEKELK